MADFIDAHGVGVDYHVPALPWEPAAAVRCLQQEVANLEGAPLRLIGSSMGGFHAAWMVERHAARAALINPVVRAHELLPAYLGENENLYTGEKYQLAMQHLEPLKALDVPVTRPQDYYLLVQTGDETLDCRRALARYSDCRSLIEPDGSHGFDHFEQHIPGILAFLGIPLPASAWDASAGV